MEEQKTIVKIIVKTMVIVIAPFEFILVITIIERIIHKKYAKITYQGIINVQTSIRMGYDTQMNPIAIITIHSIYYPPNYSLKLFLQLSNSLCLPNAINHASS